MATTCSTNNALKAKDNQLSIPVLASKTKRQWLLTMKLKFSISCFETRSVPRNEWSTWKEWRNHLDGELDCRCTEWGVPGSILLLGAEWQQSCWGLCKGCEDALPSAQCLRMNTHVHNHMFGEGGPALSGSLKLEVGVQFIATTLGKVRPEPAALGDTWVGWADSTAQVKHMHRHATQTGPGPTNCPLVAGMYRAQVYFYRITSKPGNLRSL